MAKKLLCIIRMCSNAVDVNLFLCSSSMSPFMAPHTKKPTSPRLWFTTGRVNRRGLGTFTFLEITNSFLRIWRYWNHLGMPQTLLWKFPLMTCLVFLCGGCRTQSSMILVSISTVTSTHHMLRPLHNGVVGTNCSAKLQCMSVTQVTDIVP